MSSKVTHKLARIYKVCIVHNIPVAQTKLASLINLHISLWLDQGSSIIFIK